MTPEKFKGDATEIKFDNAGKVVMDQVGVSLDEFYAQGYDANPFILMLYDEGRVPFADRINRQAFVAFYKEVLKQFPVIGTFDTYVFILHAIFGSDAELDFDVDNPGQLSIDINTASSVEYDFIGRDADGNTFEVTDQDGLVLSFRGLSGIETPYELELLFSEIMPYGISPTISLSFYERFTFVAEQADESLDEVIDHLGNNIVFTEVG